MSSSIDKRSDKWDNVKGLLILLVVVGHFCNELTDDSTHMQALYFYIYIFHMPLFLFVSGLFSKRVIHTGHKLKQRIIGYVILGYLLRFANLAVRYSFGKNPKFYLFRDTGLTWYLFALAIYLGLTYLLQKIPVRWLIVFSVIAACFAGYDKSVGSTLILSRAFVFYPFFLMGYAWDAEVSGPKTHKIWWQAGSAVLLVLILAVVYTRIGTLYRHIDLIKGWKSYAYLKDIHPGGWYRLFYYGAAVLMSAAVVILTPSRRLFLTGIGRRTMQIFLFHRPILYALVYLKWHKVLAGFWPAHWRFLYLASGLALALVLSLPVFERPVRAFWKIMEEV